MYTQPPNYESIPNSKSFKKAEIWDRHTRRIPCDLSDCTEASARRGKSSASKPQQPGERSRKVSNPVLLPALLIMSLQDGGQFSGVLRYIGDVDLKQIGLQIETDCVSEFKNPGFSA